MQHVAHAVDGRLVGGLLVAGADERGAGERGRLRDAHQLKREVAVRLLPVRVLAHRSSRACARGANYTCAAASTIVSCERAVQRWRGTHRREND